MLKRLLTWFRQTFAPTVHEQRLREDLNDKRSGSFGYGVAPGATHRGKDHWVE
jgi:hypothetical protein